MITIQNPTKKQKKVEREHEEELLILLGFLFLMLKKVKTLTPDSVRLAVQEWKLKYWPQVYAINEEAVLKIKQLSDSLIEPPSAGKISRIVSNAKAKYGIERVTSAAANMDSTNEIRRYSSATSELLESVIVAVEQKYKDLAVMVENYNANVSQIKENIEEIVKSTETSIGRFVRLCEARNLINFIFESAVENGYTQV